MRRSPRTSAPGAPAARPGSRQRAPLGEGGAQRRAHARPLCGSECPLQRLDVVLMEAVRVARVDDHRVDRRLLARELLVRARASRSPASPRGAHGDHAGERAVGDRLPRSCRPGRRSARRARSRRRSRRLQEADAVSGRRRVDDHEVVGRARRAHGARAAPAPRSCPYRAARACRGSPSRTRGTCGSPTARGRAAPTRSRRYSSIACCGIDRDREQVRSELHLARDLAVLVEGPLGAIVAAQLGDDRPQAAARCQQTERRRDSRLADASLPGDEDQSALQQRGHLVNIQRRRRRARTLPK